MMESRTEPRRLHLAVVRDEPTQHRPYTDSDVIAFERVAAKLYAAGLDGWRIVERNTEFVTKALDAGASVELIAEHALSVSRPTD